MRSQSALTLGICQYAPQVGEPESNRRLGGEWIERAASQGAELVLLPELASSGYAFASEAEARACSEPADGPTLRAWGDLCGRLGVWLVAGFSETAGGDRFNSAALVSPERLVGVYRKAHLFNDEKSFFQPGDLGFPVFDHPQGRLGLLICYDIRFPEPSRVLALRGAELICLPTNWVSNFLARETDERGWTSGNYACVGAALQNQVFVAAADRIGAERGVNFVGCSCLVAPDGTLEQGPAPTATEALLVAEVDLARVSSARQRTPRNHTFQDRRPELYGDISAVSSEDPQRAAAGAA